MRGQSFRLSAGYLLCLALVSCAVSAGAAAGPRGPGEAVDDVAWLLDGTSARATAGSFEATFVEDRDGIAVFEVEGDYDRETGGVLNIEARAAVGQAFYGDHPDDADILVVYTTFDFNTGTSTAFHLGVRNDVEGIGLPLFDNAALLGSTGRLQSYVDMADLGRYVTDPLSTGFDTALSILAHEVMHRWCCYVEVRQAGGGIGEDLLGEGGSHWSYLLDSDASLMYGADWRPNGDGTHTASAVSKFYSPLDLYLAGFLGVEEVPPFTLLENPAIDPLQLPERGAIVEAQERTVTLDDVTAAEGPRLPAAESSELRLAFLILTRPGAPVTDAHLVGVDRLRRTFATRFAALTGGRGIAHVLPEGDPQGSPGAPTPVDGGPPRPAGQSSVAEGLQWLRSVQGIEGFWQDRAATRIRDTAAALGTLAALDPGFSGRAAALAWLAAQEPLATDGRARLLQTLAREEPAAAGAVSLARGLLLERQNPDGGWGADADLASDSLDTALALEGLSAAGEIPQTAGAEALSRLLALQRSDGSWGPAPEAAGRTSVTAAVLRALVASVADPGPLEEPVLAPAAVWLAGRQSSQDGGFGDSPSTAHDTALALLALADLDALDLVDATAAEVFLRSRQTQEGSWDGSVFTTAVAIAALQRLDLPNLALRPELLLDPSEPRDGERALLTATVANTGGSASLPSLLRFYDGDPAAGGAPLGIEKVLPGLAPGEQVTVSGLWETTDAAGPHRIVAVADPDGEQVEAREDDNSAALDVTIAPPPAGVDLELRQGDLSISPPFPDTLPVQLGITAVVRNFGLADAADVQVVLWRGTPESGDVVETATLPLLGARSSLPVSFTDVLSQAGTTVYTVQASTEPPDEDSSNNRATTEVTTQATTDLEVRTEDLALSRDPAFLGTDVTVTATLRNRGTLPAPTFTARYTVTDGTETVVIRELSAAIPAGESLEQSFPWRVDRVGSLTLIAELDPEQRILEGDETNNRGELPFTASAVTEPNMTLALADLAFDPEPALEGSAAQLAIVLRNTGGTDLSDVPVAFYDGNPAAGGSLVAEVVVGSLLSGEDRLVTVAWPAVPDASDRLIFAVADPGDLVAEIDEEDNQVFRRLTVLSLPDLAVGSASLAFQPAVPLPGQNVAMTVAVANLGEQATGPFTVRAFAGDPSAGQQLGVDQVLDLAGLSGGQAAFSFTPAAGTQLITVVVDADDAVPESEESNNQAERELASQDPDFAVFPRYFSPNGDGVQDTTTFTYRLSSPRVVEVRVVDRRERIVRRQSGGAATATGSFSWDGRNDAGRLVADGELRFEVVALDGAGAVAEVLGAAAVVLDVDRSPLHEAFGTELEKFTNLSCLLAEVSSADGTDGGDSIYLGVEGASPELAAGLYRVPLTRPVPETLTAGVTVRRVAVTPDGSKFAWQQSGGQAGIWSANGLGGGTVRLTTGGGLVGISAEGARVIYSSGSPGTVRSVPSDGSGVERELFDLEGVFVEAVASADHRFLVVLDGDEGSDPTRKRTWLLDLTNDSSRMLYAETQMDVAPAFSPDGSLLALADSDTGHLRVYRTADGGLVGEFQVPEEVFPRALLTGPQRALAPDPWMPPFVSMAALDWAPQGQSLLLAARFGTAHCEGAWRLFQLEASTLATEGSAWIEPFLPVDPDAECSDGDVLPLPPMPPGPQDSIGYGDSAFAEGQVLVPFYGVARFLSSTDRILVGPWVVAEEGEVTRPFESFEDFQPESLLANGRGLLFRSTDTARHPASPCFERGSEDLWSFFSRLNLTAELQPRGTADGAGILLEGTAADLNFDSYRLEWSAVEAPDAWSPVTPPSGRVVLDGRLGIWVPPRPGAYFLRLTVADRAGNRRSVVRQVATVNSAVIADLVAAPESFSAQPGAAITHTELSYDVLRPVNLTVLIFDPSGQRVRAFQRSHPEPIDGATLLWDGRDDFGVPVADGIYRIQVQSYEVFVEVDSTPPQVSVEMRSIRFGGGAFICEAGLPAAPADLGHFLFSSFSGAAEGGSVLEVGDGVAPSTWRVLSSPTSSLELEIPEAIGRRYRGRAEDDVGNGTVRLADLPPERVSLVSIGAQLPVYYPDPREEPEDLPPVESAPVLALVPDGPLRVGLRESLRSPLVSLFLQYQIPDEPGLWREVAAETYFEVGSTTGTQTPPDHQLEALFATGLPAGLSLDLRLRAVDAAGGQHVSNLGSLFLWSLTYRGRLRSEDLDEGAPFAQGLADLIGQADLNPAEDAVFWGTKRLEDSSVGVYLRVRSGDDPDYEDWRRVEPVAVSDDLFVVTLPNLDPEADFQVRVGREAPSFCTTHDGERFEEGVCSGQRPEDCQPTPDPVRRLELTVTRDFTDEASCGLSVHEGLRVSLRPVVQGDLVAERLQLFAGETAVPSAAPLFDVANPVHQRLYTFEEILPLPLTEERSYRAVLRADDGQRVERVVRFPADTESPVPVIEAPTEGQRVCAVEGTHRCGSIGAGSFFLPIFGRVADNLGASYRLSLLVEGDGEMVELPFRDLEGNQLCYAGLGQLGAFGDHAGEVLPAGPMTLRLVADDPGGSVVCQEVPFVLDASVDPVAFGVASDLFSPNGDAVLDTAVFTYTSQEATQLTLALFPAVAPGVAGSEAVRTVVADLGVEGSGEVLWDGRDDADVVVSDGRYLAVAAFVDDCGNQVQRQQWVEVDTTSPVAAITFPAPGEPLGLVLEVMGVAADRNFQRYDVAWGASPGGASPEIFVRIGGGSAAVPGGPGGGTLVVWDTAGLVGEIVVRLVATDLVGNASEVLVPLVLPERLGVLGGSEALPGLFSPNDDGILDSTSLRFSLHQPASVDLLVVDEAGVTVRTLLEGSALPAGSRVEPWDGRAASGLVVADGSYQAVLRASAATGELEEARLPVVVDTEAPALELVRPGAGGFLRGAGEVVGSADDAHLEVWTLEVSTPGSATWSLLTEGRTSVVGDVLGNLGGLGEGSYDLRLRALDRAGNQGVISTLFTVDDTPPGVRLVDPSAGSFVSGLSGLVAVEGTVEEAHLAFYRVEVGAGASPSAFSTLAESSALPPTAALAQWNAATSAEGLVTLRLTAEDLAGGRSQDQALVTVDNTLPQVALNAPLESAYVTGPLDVTGTAADTNFARFTLDVAPEGTSQFSSVGSGEAAVVGGLLASWRALPPDGEATLRLTAEDEAGHQASVEVHVTVDTTPPAAPTGLQAVVVAANDVQLTWEANAEDDLAGYRPYRDGLLLTGDLIPSPTYLDSAVGSGTFLYSVTAVDHAGNESEPSASAEISLDLDPPTALLSRPVGGARVSGLVDILGTAFSQNDFREYRLFAEDTSGASVLRRSPVPVQSDLLGQWSTLGRPEGSTMTLRLEAEDLSGNVGESQVTVVVDNLPPAPPGNLSATVEGGDDIRLRWDVAPEADLAGYLVYREGTLVNAAGPVGDVTPYLLAPSGGAQETYLDLDLPDGTFPYTVVAVDRAGNQSLPSGEAEATVETGAPTAVLVEPEEGTEFDEPLYLLAVSEDRDVAEVLFELRAVADADWTSLGTDGELPFDASWDPLAEGRSYGEYLLRAVATDSGGRTDPAPLERRVVFADRTAPSPVLDLQVETVDGGDVALRWTAESGSGEVEGYRLLRAPAGDPTAPVVVHGGLAAGPTFTEAEVADGTWDYTIVAVDTAGNQSTPSAPARARVSTPQLVPPASPTREMTIRLEGSGVAPSWTVHGEVMGASTTVSLPAVEATAEGTFTFEEISLERGPSTLSVQASDGTGNRSKQATVQVTSAPPPAAPLWQSVEVNGQVVDLSWVANGEPDLLGYLLERDGVGVPAAYVIADATASASPPGDEEAWLALDWDEGRSLQEIEVHWTGGSPERDFDIELRLEASWRTVVQVRGNTSPTSVVPLPEGSFGTAARIRVLDATPPAVNELRILAQPLVSATSYSESLPDGAYSYTLRAVNTSGFPSPRSESREVVVGDGVPPQGVVLAGAASGSSVDLTWTASEATDVARYDLFRDGVEILRHTDLGDLSTTDGPLANGTYVYQVAAVDVGGNRSELSNAVAVTVSIDPPSEPTLHPVVPGPASLLLSWTAASGAPPTAYRLVRSISAGGPYGALVTTSESSFEDGGLTVGQEYFYVVTSLDSLGNPSPFSNEQSGIPLELDPLEAPRWTEPTVAGVPFLTSAPTVDVAGTAEAGSSVTVLRNGIAVGEVPALDPALEPVPSLMVAGRMDPSPDGSLLAVEGSALYSSSVVDLASAVETEVPLLKGPPRWFSDGQRIAYPNDGQPTVYDLRDGSTQGLGFATDIVAVVPARGLGLARERVGALASRLGADGLWTFTAGSFLWTLQLEAPLASFDEHSLRWSPDGSRLLFKHGTLAKAWEIVDVGTSTIVTLAPQAGSSQADFAPDGSLVALTRTGAEGEQVWLVDPLTSVGEAVTTGPGEHFEPRFSPDGLQIAFLNGEGHLFLLDLASGISAPGGRVFDPALDRATAGQWKWTPAGMIFNRSGEVVLRSAQARFELLDAPLAVGDNVFAARAELAEGGSSPLSDEMVVTRSVEGLPDFDVGDGDLTLLPSLPRVGEAARLTVVVTNQAGTAAPQTEVRVAVLDSNGAEVPLPTTSPLPPLGPGETAAVVLDLAGLAEGRHEVSVVVDPEEIVDEVSEANNRASFTFVVVSDAAPEVSVETNQEIYLSGETVQVGATVTNGGETFSGLLELYLEDAEGRPVRLLEAVPIAELTFGSRFEVETQWQTAEAFAGSYRAAARLADGAGVPVDEAFVGFEVAEDFEVTAAVFSDRQIYVRGEEAVLRGVLTYVAGNAVLEGVQTHLRVEGPDGNTVAQWTREVGSLLPRGEVTDQRIWSTASTATGSYRLFFEASRQGRPLAAEEGGFEVSLSVPSLPALAAEKVAELAVDADGDGRPSPGDTVLYRIRIESVGESTALNVVLDDPIPFPGEVVSGSVTTDRGSVESTDPVQVVIGDLAPGEVARVAFQVLLPSPWPASDLRLVNQGLLSAIGLSGVPTDDPSTLTPADPTVTQVFVSPVLTFSKVDALVEDRDGDGIPGAGDDLGYVLTVSNGGSALATGLRLTDFIPSHTVLVPGSVAVSAGTVTGEDPVKVELPTLAPGASWTVAFEVQVSNPLPLEVRQVTNQASVASAELPVVFSDDPDRSGSEDPTLTSVTAEAVLFAEKTASLAVDRDGDGQVSPGDTLLYRLELGNGGNTAAAGVLVTDLPSPLTAVEAGSVQTSGGTIVSEDPVVVDVGQVEVDAIVAITFLARIDEAFPSTNTEVLNQAAVSTFDGDEPVLSDDPTTAEERDPTRTEVFITPQTHAEDGTAVEGDLSLSFSVNLDAPSNRPVVIGYSTEDGSALAGDDYVASSGTLTFVPGETSVVVSVELLDDTFPEGSESFFLRLTTIEGGVLVDEEGEGTILDDDLASGLGATLEASLVEDSNGDGVVNPGDTLEVRGEIENSGEATLTGISFEAPVPEWTQVVAGSVMSSAGSVIGEDPVRVEIPLLEAAGDLVIRYRLVVANPIPQPELEITTQGTVGSDQLEVILTDDPGRPGTADPTIISVVGESLLTAHLTAELDPDTSASAPEGSSSTAQPGDILLFHATLDNPGTAALNSVVFILEIPDHTILVPDSVEVSQGSVVGLNPLTIEASTIWPPIPAEVRFEAQIDPQTPPSVREIVAQGWVSSEELSDTPTDDPSVPGAADPTVVALEHTAVEIPALSGGALAAFTFLLAAASLAVLRRRRRSRPAQPRARAS